jgi:hypothetical protein
LLGKALHAYHYDRLMESEKLRTIYVCLDPDAREFQTRIGNRLSKGDREVKFVNLEGGDPNSVSPDQLMRAFDAAVSTTDSSPFGWLSTIGTWRQEKS